MLSNTIIPANLTLFDEGGGGSAPAAGASQGGAKVGGEQMSETQTLVSAGQETEKTGVLDTVVLGRPPENGAFQADAQSLDAGGENQTGADTAPPQKTLEERRAEYEKLREEYKDLLGEDFQKTFNRRFKASKEMETAYKTQSDFLNKLHQMHGTKTVDELDSAIMGSTDFLKPLADSLGMTVSAYRNHLTSALGNAKQQRAADNMAAIDRENTLVQGVVNEAMQLKRNPEFAQFDLAQALKDPDFRKKILSGQSVKSAYLDKNFDGLVKNLKQSVANGTEKRVVDSIRAKGTRPPENGTSANSGKVYLNDVSKLTKAQRAEAAKRALKGDKITFK